MTDAELLGRFTEISEKNLFPIHFGDGAILTGLPPNDIYQLGFFGAFNECHLAVREFVDQKLVAGILKIQKERTMLEQMNIVRFDNGNAIAKEAEGFVAWRGGKLHECQAGFATVEDAYIWLTKGEK